MRLIKLIYLQNNQENEEKYFEMSLFSWIFELT